MVVQAVSDLHLEMSGDMGERFLKELKPLADVLILAGDITSAKHYASLRHVFYDLISRWKHIIYVPGNHEYYRSSPDEVAHNLTLVRREFPSVSVLENEDVTINGQRFIGGTMWFPNKPNQSKFVESKRFLNDFYMIRGLEPWVYEQSNLFRELLRQQLRSGDVVVTHHLPTWKSVHKRYAGSDLNAFFVNDVSALIDERQPRLWIHGHTHTACDYKQGQTRVVANPRGYPNEGGTGFDPEFVIEV